MRLGAEVLGEISLCLEAEVTFGAFERPNVSVTPGNRMVELGTIIFGAISIILDVFLEHARLLASYSAPLTHIASPSPASNVDVHLQFI